MTYIEGALVFLMVINVVTLACVVFLAISQEKIITRIVEFEKVTNAAIARVNVVSKFTHRHKRLGKGGLSDG